MNATQSMSEREINALNLTIRQTPWYQQWFASQGLNPNRVKLTDTQRADLARTAAANGYQLGDRMKIDEAGNINQQGGYAGMPTWAKVAIAAAPVAGSMLIPGVREATIGNIGSIFGAGGGTTGTTAAATGAVADGTLGTIAGVAGPAAGFGFKDILMAGLNPAIATVGGIYANRAQTSAARDAADAQTRAANYAADIQGQGAAAQLEFLREQEATRRREFEETQSRNFALAQEEQGYTRGLDARRYENLEPYRRVGVGSLYQLGQPIKNIRQGRA